MTIEDIAKCCHEANRLYCAMISDPVLDHWDNAPAWQKLSCISGVRFHIEYPTAGPQGSHENWMADKAKDGWVYGETKDPEAKTHPCMVAYDDLPIAQRVKDVIFVSIVHALAPLLEEAHAAL